MDIDAPEKPHVPSYEYELTAVINHHGVSAAGGHYTAHIRDEEYLFYSVACTSNGMFDLRLAVGAGSGGPLTTTAPSL